MSRHSSGADAQAAGAAECEALAERGRLNVAMSIERFFTERLMRQRNVSGNTIASYRDTFRLLFMFAQVRLLKPPSAQTPVELDATFIGAFLTDLEAKRGTARRRATCV
ncbi:hypothetical protein NKH74_33950 [Mesorhizobium sp. M0933]|uniref:hypothetical protein n=1 Tax=Mesorhizobium sp. M0933 TaxID=2957030 RepID=UPI003337B2C1